MKAVMACRQSRRCLMSTFINEWQNNKETLQRIIVMFDTGQPHLERNNIYENLQNRLHASEVTWQRGKNRSKITEFGIQKLSLKPAAFGLTVWDLATPIFTCPFALERLGKIGDGGKWVCGFEEIVSQKPSCLVYSFGIQMETSFETDILDLSTNCTVRMFDHTIKVPPTVIADYPRRAYWHPLGISSQDSESLRSLKSLMQAHGDTFIDILKLDIEGSEFAVLANIIQDFPRRLPFSQLLVEIHLDSISEEERGAYFLSFLQNVEAAGLRKFFSEINFISPKPSVYSEFSFINVLAELFKS